MGLRLGIIRVGQDLIFVLYHPVPVILKDVEDPVGRVNAFLLVVLFVLIGLFGFTGIDIVVLIGVAG